MSEGERTPQAGTLLVSEKVAHPEDSVLSAMAEKRLKGAERDRLLKHLDGCPRCREVLVALEGEGPLGAELRTVTKDPLLGEKVGEYLVTSLIAQGGMGRVYRAERVADRRPVALKVIVPDGADDPELARRMQLEAKAIGAIRHPHIVDVYGGGALPDGRSYLAMELLEGFSLRERLAEKGRLTPAEVAVVLDQAMQALTAAHAASVVHRDLKPGNLFVRVLSDGSWHLKLLDFGLAKRLDRTGLTSANVVVGTPAYMAPEQIRGQGIGDRSDVYSMGVVAWELLTGKVPFDAPSLVDVMRLHLDAILPALPPNLGIPTALEALLVKMLQKRPTDRPSAQAVAREAQAVRRFFNIAPSSEATQLQDRPAWAPEGSASTAATAPMPAIPSWVGAGALGPPPKRVEPETDRSLQPQQPMPETIKVSPLELRAKVAAAEPASAMTIRDPVPVPVQAKRLPRPPPSPEARRRLLIGVGVIVLVAIALTVTAVVTRVRPAVVAPSPAKAPIEVAPPPPPHETIVAPDPAPAEKPVAKAGKGKLTRADVETELAAAAAQLSDEQSPAARSKQHSRLEELKRRLAAGAKPEDIHAALEKLKAEGR